MFTKSVQLNNDTLQGELRYANHCKRLVIVCHGYQSSSNHPALIAIVKGLNAKGHATFTFNFSDKGGLNLKHQVADIKTIVEYFQDKQDYHIKEIVLLAASFGALSASIAASLMPEIKGLITLNGFFGSSELGPKHRSTFKKFRILTTVSPHHRLIWSFYKKEFQPGRIAAAVLVIYPSNDEVVFKEQSLAFYNQLTGPKQVKVLPDADHNITSPDDIRTVIDTIDTWLN